MVRQIQVESQEDLLQCWQTCGILIQPTDGCERAPLKVSMETLRAHWQEHCVVIAIDRGAGRPKTLRASCWHFAHHGHCSHLYAVQQLEGLQTGQAALKQGAVPEYDCALGSSEDEAGRKKRKKKEKKAKVSVPRTRKKERKKPSRSCTPGRARSRTPGRPRSRTPGRARADRPAEQQGG